MRHTESPAPGGAARVQRGPAGRVLGTLLLSAYAALCWGDASYRVVGSSMEPTLAAGDVIRVQSAYYDGRSMERDTLVAIKFRTRPVPFVKRVVAIAGDRVHVRDGRIHVGERSYGVPRRGASLLATQLARYGGRVPADHFIALGDNPNASFDSASFGLLSRRQLLGRVQVPVSAAN